MPTKVKMYCIGLYIKILHSIAARDYDWTNTVALTYIGIYRKAETTAAVSPSVSDWEQQEDPSRCLAYSTLCRQWPVSNEACKLNKQPLS